MKNILVAAVVLFGVGTAMAQSFPQGELQVFYQGNRSFDYRSGSPAFDIRDAGLKGGGFGFAYNITGVFGLWQQMGFYTGVKQGGLDLNLINEMQGLLVTKRDVGPFNFFAKGGVGFTRYVFEQPGFTLVSYGQTFSYGGGAQIRLSPGFHLLLELNQMAMGLPDITGARDRAKWDSNLLITTGIAIHF